MTPLTQQLNTLILKPTGAALQEDAQLIPILKRRLTKKEYKLLIARAEGTPTREALQQKLALDDDRYERLWQNIVKKLNSDTIKRELYSY